jgi:hypothetical protein
MAAFGIRRRCCVRGERQIPRSLSCFHGENSAKFWKHSGSKREGMGAGSCAIKRRRLIAEVPLRLGNVVLLRKAERFLVIYSYRLIT